MTPQQMPSEKVQLIDLARTNRAVSVREVAARDFSTHYQERVCSRFVATQSIKQTARDFDIPARVVSEILHLANFRRPMAVARSSGSSLFGVRDARCVA